MADRYDFCNKGSSGGRSMREEDFDEEDVWAVVKERTDNGAKVKKSKDPSSVSTPRGLPTTSRLIPRSNNSTPEAKVVQQSAPVNIPDWSKIYRKNSSKKGTSESDCQGSKDGSWVDDGDETIDEDDGDDDEDDDKVPPHEWIAKKLARSQISTFSVCEGVGRTLKGRDLSKVRNAVLTKTGFLE